MSNILNSFTNDDGTNRIVSSNRAATIGYFGSFIVFGLLAAAIGPTLPGMAENTHSLLSQISLVFTAQSFGYLGGSVFGGRLFDRFPGHPLLSGVLIGMAVLAFFIPLASSLWLLTGIFLILGSMQGALEVGNNTLLVWVHKDRVGPYMNALHFFFGLGAIVSPIIVVRSVAAIGDFRWVYWVLGMLAIPIAFWQLRLPSPRNPDHHETAEASRANAALVILVAVLLFLYVGAEVSYAGWVYTYATSKFSFLTASSAALLTSTFWGSFTAGRLISIPMAMRIKPSTVLLVDLVGCIVSIGMIALFPGSLAVIWAGTIGLGLFMAAFFPTTVTLAGKRMKITGRISGWFFVGAGAGGMVLPWIIGQLFEPVGPGVVLAIILADLVLTLAVLGVFLYLALPAARAQALQINQDQ